MILVIPLVISIHDGEYVFRLEWLPSRGGGGSGLGDFAEQGGRHPPGGAKTAIGPMSVELPLDLFSKHSTIVAQRETPSGIVTEVRQHDKPAHQVGARLVRSWCDRGAEMHAWSTRQNLQDSH